MFICLDLFFERVEEDALLFFLVQRARSQHLGKTDCEGLVWTAPLTNQIALFSSPGSRAEALENHF